MGTCRDVRQLHWFQHGAKLISSGVLLNEYDWNEFGGHQRQAAHLLTVYCSVKRSDTSAASVGRLSFP